MLTPVVCTNHLPQDWDYSTNLQHQLWLDGRLGEVDSGHEASQGAEGEAERRRHQALVAGDEERGADALAAQQRLVGEHHGDGHHPGRRGRDRRHGG